LRTLFLMQLLKFSIYVPQFDLVLFLSLGVAFHTDVEVVLFYYQLTMRNRFTISRTGEMGVHWCRFRGQKGNSG
jgi:hypothetical protein